jgi:hypothetical protein
MAQRIVVPGVVREARNLESLWVGILPAVVFATRCLMDVVYTFCAGMDVHKKTVVVCCMTPDATGAKQIETRTFGTMTQDLLTLSDWLTSKQITHVAMESTGELWKPVYNILEGSITVS